jgi:hypothetical protein
MQWWHLEVNIYKRNLNLTISIEMRKNVEKLITEIEKDSQSVDNIL